MPAASIIISEICQSATSTCNDELTKFSIKFYYSQSSTRGVSRCTKFSIKFSSTRRVHQKKSSHLREKGGVEVLMLGFCCLYCADPYINHFHGTTVLAALCLECPRRPMSRRMRPKAMRAYFRTTVPLLPMNQI